MYFSNLLRRQNIFLLLTTVTVKHIFLNLSTTLCYFLIFFYYELLFFCFLKLCFVIFLSKPNKKEKVLTFSFLLYPTDLALLDTL